jgi:hypothetical protein
MPANKKPKKKSAKKPKSSNKPNGSKPHGHYCWVCGENKANEKFSGRGHATHMCKQCHALPVEERNKMVAIRKAGNMAFRYLSEQEIKWLRKKMNDPRPEVRDAAREAHAVKFPRYERGTVKKGLTAFSLELYIRGEVWNEWGDETNVHMLVVMDDTGSIRRTDYTAPEGERESDITVDSKEAKAFLKSVIHEYDALFWDEDLSDAEPSGYDPYLDILPEYCTDFNDDEDDDVDSDGNTDIDGEYMISEPDVPVDNREPLWSLSLELNNGEEKKIEFYNQMHDAPQELFRAIMDWFEPADDEFDTGGDE